MKTVLVADKVDFSYGPKRIISDITLKINKQDSVVFLGSSGSGKSTFLKICCGLLRPTDGKVEINGVKLYDLTSREKSSFMIKKIGFLFQDGALINNLSVFDNIALPLRYHGLFREKEIIERVEEVLEQFEITNLRASNPATLSLGQRKFVAFARVFFNRTKYTFS